jgi:hypothetical protein
MGPFAGQEFPTDMGIRSVAAFAWTPLMQMFDTTQDVTLLRSKVWPYLRGVVDFYINPDPQGKSYLVRGVDGKLHVPFSCGDEICHDEYGQGVDPMEDMGFVRMALSKAIDYSTVLGVDAELRPRWQSALQEMAGFRTTHVNGVEVFAQSASFTDNWNRTNETAGWPGTARVYTGYPIIYDSGIHPADVITRSSDPALLQVARNTVWVDGTNVKWNPVNGFVLSWIPAARIVEKQNASTLLDGMEAAIRSSVYLNWYHPHGGGGYEDVGAVEAVNCMLLLSIEGFLRFFPAWPLGEAASFRGLRASGALLVNASVDRLGLVSGIELLAEAGGEVKFLAPCAQPQIDTQWNSPNPWCKMPMVRCGGQPVVVQALTAQAHMYAFNASVGAQCTIENPVGSPHSPPPPQPPLLLRRLRECADHLSDPSYENASLLIWDMFQDAIASDSRNTAAIAKSYSAFYRHENVTRADTAAAQALPRLEFEASTDIVKHALAACSRLVKQPATAQRPPTRSIGLSNVLELEAGSRYFRTSQDGKSTPYFPFGWNQAPPYPTINFTRGTMLKSELHCVDLEPARLFTKDPEQQRFNSWGINETVQGIKDAYAVGFQPILFLGMGRAASSHAPTQHAMPAWALHQYPGIATDAGHTHFCSFDIDNPGARDVWSRTLSAAVPRIFADAMPAQGTLDNNRPLLVSLHNEPGWFSANSTYTLQKYVRFLLSKYENITALNAAWGDHVSSFEDEKLRSRMRSVPWLKRAQSLDWSIFNADRVTDWFTWLCETAKNSTGNGERVKCMVKASNGESPLGFAHGDGINRLALSAVLDLNGCDTRAEWASGQSHLAFPQLPTSKDEAFAMDWIGMMGSYDFMASTEPTKPTVDYEWHAVSTVRYRAQGIPHQYLHTALWLSHIHGLSANQVWMWGREGWSGAAKISQEFGGADFVESIWAQPQLVDAYVRSSLQLNSLSDLVAALATSPRKIFLLYSPSAAMMGDVGYLQTQLAVYSLAALLGVQVGFATTSQLGAAGGSSQPSGCSRESPCTRLVPCMLSIDAEVAAALPSQELPGVQTLTVGNASACDAAFAFNSQGGPLNASARHGLLGLQRLDIGNVAGRQAFDLLEKRLRPSITQQLVICAPLDRPDALATYGVHCRSARVGGKRIAVAVTNLLNGTTSVALLSGRDRSRVRLVTFATNNTVHAQNGLLELGSLETVVVWADI